MHDYEQTATDNVTSVWGLISCQGRYDEIDHCSTAESLTKATWFITTTGYYPDRYLHSIFFKRLYSAKPTPPSPPNNSQLPQRFDCGTFSRGNIRPLKENLLKKLCNLRRLKVPEQGFVHHNLHNLHTHKNIKARTSTQMQKPAI